MTVRIEKPAINLREELADLRKPTGIAGEAMLRAETPQEQQALIGVGRKNLIINGDCNISQRGDFTTASSSTDETYYLDRFQQNHNITANKQHITSNQPSALSNTKSWRLTATATTNGFMGTRQTIEDYKLFNGREFTASVWVKTNHPSVRFYLFDGSNTDQGKKTAIADGEWHYLQETFTFDATAGTKLSIEVIILSEAGSNTSITSGDYVEFTGLQVELGKVATPFEHRSYGEELALCQRYYQISRATSGAPYKRFGRGGNVSTTLAEVTCFLPVEMRAFPSVDTTNSASDYAVYHGSTVTACSVIPALNTAADDGAGNVMTLGCTVSSGLTVGQASALLANNSATCFLAFKSEL